MPVDFLIDYVILHVAVVLADFVISILRIEWDWYEGKYACHRIYMRMKTTALLLAGSVFCFIGDEMEFTVILAAVGCALFPYKEAWKSLRKGERA